MTNRELTPRQREILERALELVEENGLAKLTLKRVAARVGFTEAAIYRHFPNKAALVDGIVRLLGERLLGPIGAIATNGSAPALQRLEQMVRHHVGLLRETRGLPFLLLAEGLATGDERLLGRIRAVFRDYLARLGDVVDELDLPLRASREARALLFVGLPAALGLQARANPTLALGDRAIDDLVRYYVRALARPAGRHRVSSPRGAPEAANT